MSGYKRVNYYELCRLCTSSQGEKKHIFCEDGQKLALLEKIRACLEVHVTETDSLPKIICHACVEKLNFCHEFRASCRASESMLQSYFTTMRHDTFNDAKVYIRDKEPDKLKLPRAIDKTSDQMQIIDDKLVKSVTNKVMNTHETFDSQAETQTIDLTNAKANDANCQNNVQMSRVAFANTFLGNQIALPCIIDQSSGVPQLMINLNSLVQTPILTSQTSPISQCSKCHSVLDTSSQCKVCIKPKEPNRAFNKPIAPTIVNMDVLRSQMTKSDKSDTLKRQLMDKHKQLRKEHDEQVRQLQQQLRLLERKKEETAKDGAFDDRTSHVSNQTTVLQINQISPTNQINFTKGALEKRKNRVKDVECDAGVRKLGSNCLNKSSPEKVGNVATLVQGNHVYQQSSNGCSTTNQTQMAPIALTPSALNNLLGPNFKIAGLTTPFPPEPTNQLIQQSKPAPPIQVYQTQQSKQPATITYEDNHADNPIPNMKNDATVNFTEVKTVTHDDELDNTHPGNEPVAKTRANHFACEHCERTFKRKEHLGQHVKLHSGERPFKCPRCDKSFARKEHVLRHVVSHTGVKSFQCDQCLKTFSRKDNLHKHRKTHESARRYTCDVCGKTFTIKQYYLAHKSSQCRKKLDVKARRLKKTTSTTNKPVEKIDIVKRDALNGSVALSTEQVETFLQQLQQSNGMNDGSMIANGTFVIQNLVALGDAKKDGVKSKTAPMFVTQLSNYNGQMICDTILNGCNNDG